MHFMVIERFRSGDPGPVYRRLREQGRLIPAGVAFVSSWVTDDLTTCFQVMEAADRSALEDWTEHWSDIVDFEILAVVTSDEARRRTTGD